MNNEIWAKVHGATVHFPIAMVVCSGALDLSGSLFQRPATRRGLHAAGYWTMLLGALGTVPAAFSGLVMSRGVVLGHDTLRLHHLFAWPAFAMTVGVATWRLFADDFATQKAPGGYLVAAGFAAVLVMVAGYYGGELMLGR